MAKPLLTIYVCRATQASRYVNAVHTCGSNQDVVKRIYVGVERDCIVVGRQLGTIRSFLLYSYTAEWRYISYLRLFDIISIFYLTSSALRPAVCLRIKTRWPMLHLASHADINS